MTDAAGCSARDSNVISMVGGLSMSGFVLSCPSASNVYQVESHCSRLLPDLRLESQRETSV